MDLYAGAVWAGTESPENSGNFSTAKMPFKCAYDSPIQCNIVPAGISNATPALGYVYSFAEDNKKDVYMLTSRGVYRVARPSRCNFLCAKEHAVNSVTHGQRSCSPMSTELFRGHKDVLFFLLSYLVLYTGFHLVNYH